MHALVARLKGSRSTVLVILAITAACSSPPSSAPPPTMTAPAPRVPIGQLPGIDVDALVKHTKTLSSDEFQGRAPGTKGEELAVTYIADQFKKVGLQPGNRDGSYFQKVPLVGITPKPAPLVFAKGSERQT